ncbi:MAG: hypothetical protein HXX18_10475 [Bacteroidetes bacterium]|nr:hypothetical protein [Bacteroidota bacterium]
MKKIFFLLFIGILIIGSNIGCKNKGKQKTDSTNVAITVDSFLVKPETWAGKDIVITGTVSHICKHSGKKLFLFGADPETTVKVNAGGEMSTFDLKYEGTDVEITGTVIEDQKVDANFLNDWEAEIKASLEDKDQKVCTEDGKALKGQKNKKGEAQVKETSEETDPYASVKEFRKKLEESGKTYISIYAIDCKTLKAIKK